MQAEWIVPGLFGIDRSDRSHRKAGAIAIDSYNGNIMSTFLGHLKHTAAEVVAGQESRIEEGKIKAAEKKAKWLGKHLHAPPGPGD